MPTVHTSLPSLLVQYLFLMRNVHAIDVLKIHFLPLDDHLRQFEAVLFDHPQHPLLALVLLVHHYALLQFC